MKLLHLLTLLLFLCPIAAFAQTAEVGGSVKDTSGAVIPKASIEFLNQATGIRRAVASNGQGQYRIADMDPGKYDATVRVTGFRTLTRENIVLQVGDKAQIDFTMQVGQREESVTVDGSGETINTTDASVGTVIDRQFVENIPMNGRSFQSLILLSPGTVTNTPQSTIAQNRNDTGEYSVNGMRTIGNNFTVDGVSASNYAGNTAGAGTAGSLSNATALGTTQAILSIDALEEFRIATSTYSAEYGRQPGGQVSFRSRSGTNEYHGSVFDYLRNSAFDSDNWFNTYSTTPIPTPAERQNDFGGTLGGPISLPRLYSGKDRTFFFFSYEGLRLVEPGAATIIYVPSNGTFNTGTYSNPEYKNLREYAPSALQDVLNSFPAPNCDTSIDSQCVDYAEGGSPYLFTPNNAGTINSINARVDYQLLPTMRVFARYSDTTSSSVGDTLTSPTLSTYAVRNRTYLLGADNTFGGTISNELRLQYAPAFMSQQIEPLQNLPGATSLINLDTAQGLPPIGGETGLLFSLPNSGIFRILQEMWGGKQFQPNAVDTIAWTHGKHLVKAGVDYRQTTAYLGDGDLNRGPQSVYSYTSAANVINNKASISTYNYQRTDPTTKNLGLFVQDEWRIHPRLSVSLGLRWELNPPPSISGAQLYTYTGDVNDPSSLGLSERGAPLYKTTYHDFAPRVGMAYVIHNAPGHETVLRAGGGLFYDTISLLYLLQAGTGLGAQANNNYTGAWPLTASQIMTPVNIPPEAPYTFSWYPVNNMVPPSAAQWNVSLEQAFGEKQTLTIGYVSSLGRNLSTEREYSVSKLNPLFNTMTLLTNGPGSNYNSLQVKYQRQMSHGLQALASYTWSHAIDWASADSSGAFPLQRGNSDNDVRHNFTAALVYSLPRQYDKRFEKAVLGYWSTDLWFVARTAFPYEPAGPTVIDPATGDEIAGELNYNGKYPYVHKAGIPGGRQIDPSIFSVTSAPLGAGNAPRNFLRGFGESQANVSIQRNFPILERTQLLFRAEAFNLLNHPTFGSINATCGTSTANQACNNVLMGQATNTLSTGLGGLSSLYQQGGPRSLQFMLKLQF